MTAPIVTFDYAAFVAQFPEFNGVGAMALQSYFNRATAFCDASGCGPVTDPGTLLSLLYLLTAHIAALAARGSGAVGRVASSGEGGVSVSLDAGPITSASQAWYMQTTYGQEYWTATAAYRRGFYAPQLQPSFAGPFNGGAYVYPAFGFPPGSCGGF